MQRDDSGRDDSGRADQEPGFVHPDPVMDAALDWLFTLQSTIPGTPGSGPRSRTGAEPRHGTRRPSRLWRKPGIGRNWTWWPATSPRAPRRQMTGRSIAAPPRTRRGRRVWRGLAVAAAIALVVGVLQSPGLMTRVARRLHDRDRGPSGHRAPGRLPDGVEHRLGVDRFRGGDGRSGCFAARLSSMWRRT